MRNSSIKTTYVEAGTYRLVDTLTLTFADSGEAWRSRAPDDTAILDGGATNGSTGLLHVILIDGGSNITIDGLQIQHAASAGIAVHGGAAFERFFTSTGAADGNVIINNIIHDIYAPASNVFENGGIVIEGKATNTKVLNNVVYNGADMGMRAGSNDDGNTPDDDISGTVFENNVVYDIGGVRAETAGIYVEDTTARSTNIVIRNNFIRDYQKAGDQGRGIYLDLGTSNTTVTRNIVAAGAVAEPGSSAIFLSTGHDNVITGNIIDLGSSGKVITLSYLKHSTTLPPMTGNEFGGNVILSSHTGAQATDEFNAHGYSYITGFTGSPPPRPLVRDNFYCNYAGGTIDTGGNHFGDSHPIMGDPEISGRTYTVATGSPVFGGPVNFHRIDGHWGPSGYSIPQRGAAPSSSTR